MSNYYAREYYAHIIVSINLIVSFIFITMENYNVGSVCILSHNHEPLLLFACSQVQKLGEYLSLVPWLKEDKLYQLLPSSSATLL